MYVENSYLNESFLKMELIDSDLLLEIVNHVVSQYQLGFDLINQSQTIMNLIFIELESLNDVKITINMKRTSIAPEAFFNVSMERG